jgi:hypothetical protein
MATRLDSDETSFAEMDRASPDHRHAAIAPGALVCTVTSRVVVPSGGSVPKVQVTDPAALVHAGGPGTVDTRVVPAGRVSRSVPPAACEGPWFWATTLYVRL